MITIENLSKVFKVKEGDVVALQNINLNISKGEIFGIIGMSGAGKSTLLRCLSMLEKPTAGSITLDGKNLARLSHAEKRRAHKDMGVVFQGYNLLMQKNVYENIAFPLNILGTGKDIVRTLVTELLELVGLSDKAKAYPAQLSGGQKQRVALARALATSPKVLLCDEPTSALDSVTTRSVLRLLKDINNKLGVTIIIITHEIAVVKSICNRVAVMDESEIVEIGEVAKVMYNPETQATRGLLGLDEDGR